MAGNHCYDWILKKLISLEVDKFKGLTRCLSQHFGGASKRCTIQTSTYKLINLSTKCVAFTMAEILISLAIIGIIAAITLPSLIGNINEKTFAAKRKALYSRMSQAIALMPSLNGYGVDPENETNTANNATQAFITDGLSKVLKISNVCAVPSGTDYNARRDAFAKCGFPKKITKMGTNSKIDTPTTLPGLNYTFSYSDNYVNYSQINTISAAFETVNGESILTFYNPNCSYVLGMNNVENNYYRGQNLMQPTMCANFIYDLNGKKGPNKVGKDIGFITAFYPTDSQVVAPMPVGHLRVTKGSPYPTFTIGNGNASCRTKYGEDTKMANIEELKSVFVNNSLGYISSSTQRFLSYDGYISSTINSNQKAYSFRGYNGSITPENIGYNSSDYTYVFCVRK